MTDEEKKEFEEFLEWKKLKREAEQQKAEQQKAEQEKAEQQKAEQEKAEQQKTEQQKYEQSTSSTLTAPIPDKTTEDKEDVDTNSSNSRVDENNSNSQLDDESTKKVIRVCLAILVVAIILIFADIKCSNQTPTANRTDIDTLSADTTSELEDVPSYDESVDDESVDDESSYRPTVEVKNSAWDGSVKQVEDYLQATLRDPDSYESIEWSEVKRKDDGYYVRHKYRAKNGFGGYVVANQLFHLDFDGNVVGVTNLY